MTCSTRGYPYTKSWIGSTMVHAMQLLQGSSHPCAFPVCKSLRQSWLGAKAGKKDFSFPNHGGEACRYWTKKLYYETKMKRHVFQILWPVKNLQASQTSSIFHLCSKGNPGTCNLTKPTKTGCRKQCSLHVRPVGPPSWIGPVLVEV